MDASSQVLLAAFLGSALGLPAGFLAIQVIQYLVSLRDRRNEPQSDMLEWAIAQRGAHVIAETQVAGNWVKTIDISELEKVDNDGNWIPMPTEMIAPYVTQVVGSVGTPPPVPSSSPEEADENHQLAVFWVRKKLGLKRRA